MITTTDILDAKILIVDDTAANAPALISQYLPSLRNPTTSSALLRREPKISSANHFNSTNLRHL